jgi:hypothetical protein
MIGDIQGLVVSLAFQGNHWPQRTRSGRWTSMVSLPRMGPITSVLRYVKAGPFALNREFVGGGPVVL